MGGLAFDPCCDLIVLSLRVITNIINLILNDQKHV